MIEGIEFSGRGEPPTTFERRLLQQAAADSHWLTVARRLIADLGPDLGARALVAVLDEVGAEKVHVPSRRHFFDQLWRQERNALICDLMQRPDSGWGPTSIGELVGLHPSRVLRIYHHAMGNRPAVRPPDDSQ